MISRAEPQFSIYKISVALLTVNVSFHILFLLFEVYLCNVTQFFCKNYFYSSSVMPKIVCPLL